MVLIVPVETTSVILSGFLKFLFIAVLISLSDLSLYIKHKGI